MKSIEDIDAFFHELEEQKKPIGKELDLDIRMSLQKVKLQIYYDSKLKEYRKKHPDIPLQKIEDKIPLAPTISSGVSKKKKKLSRVEKRLKKDELIVQKKISEIKKEESVRFNNFRQIDLLVNFFKSNNGDLNAVTENWIRHHITSPEILEYYKDRMQKEVRNYRSVVYRMLNMSQVSAKDRRQQRIDKFRKKISSIITSKNVAPTISKPKGKESTSFEILKKKDWILDWNCVMFKRGSVVIYCRSDLPVKFKPETVYVPKALESFNYLKKYLNERLPPVRCSIVGMTLKVIDTINFSSAIQEFATAAKQGAIRTTGRGGARNIGPSSMSFGQALSKAKQMTLEEFKNYKSKFIDYLVSMQSEKFKVIPCVERLAHTNVDTTENAFMFSIVCSKGNILIVYENVNPDRSTLLFLVGGNDYDTAIREIYDFLQSPEVNKRSSIRERSVEIRNAGVRQYRSINHDEFYSWRKWIYHYKHNA